MAIETSLLRSVNDRRDSQCLMRFLSALPRRSLRLCGETSHKKTHRRGALSADMAQRFVRTVKAAFVYLRFTIYDLPSSFMRRAIYPGSFDPVTNGHLDIIQRGCKLFDEIIVAILVNPEKTPFFSVEERKEILADVLQQIEKGGCKVVVDSFEGLLVQYAADRKANAIVRGIRAISDYEYELQMALMNRRLEPALETVFMMPAEAYSYVSSRLVKEVFQLGGSINGLVPALVEQRMRTKSTVQSPKSKVQNP
jgi:pantetheine-phosphate adenylyltransferase